MLSAARRVISAVVVVSVQCVPAERDWGDGTMGNERVMPRWAAVLASVVAVLSAVGCSDDDGGEDEASADTTEAVEAVDTTPAENTTTTLSPEAEVEAAVMAYEAMASRLIQAPNPNDPEIAQRTTGEYRTYIEASLQELMDLGHAGQLGPNTTQTVLRTEVSGDRATVEVCAVDDGTLIEVATGRVLNDDVVTDHSAVSLERTDGAWLVVQRSRIARWEGVNDCA